MCCFVIATDFALSPFYFSGSLDPVSDVFASFYPLSDSELNLILSFSDLGSFYVSIPAFGIDGFYPFIPDDGIVYIGDSLGFFIQDEGDSYTLVFVSPSFSGPFSGYFFIEKLSEDSPDLLSDLRLTGTSFLETVQGIVVTIGKNPLLLLTVGIFFVGGCIAIFSRLLSKN